MGKQKVAPKPKMKAKPVTKSASKPEPNQQQKPLQKQELKPESKPESMQVQPHPALSRNDPCYCGSGKKYKKCHLFADQEAHRKQFELEAAEAKKIEPEKKDENPIHDQHVNNSRPSPSHMSGNTATRTLFKRKIGSA